ncbi:MbnP family copper-binding protein [Neptunicella sp. SCSIO 80796]|uniref:MbnP family copper-binding protein n=1 Tax=Neptunicella plasticusilytica TaxID=3117012 RepID=UPI003A4E2CF5
MTEKLPYIIAFVCVCLAGCEPMPFASIVQFDIQYLQHPIDCKTSISNNDRQWQINQFNWFVSDIEIQQQGQWRPLTLQVSDRQTESVALLMLDDCQQRSVSSRQLVLSETIDWRKGQRIRFNLGIPFAANHANPLRQPSPLNLPFMFWSWQGGHKFLRLDLQSELGSWSFHLGSTGCQADSAMRSPVTACQQPNLFQFEIPVSTTGHIVMQLDALLAGVELAKSNSCTFHYAEQPVCQLLIDHLPQMFANTD